MDQTVEQHRDELLERLGKAIKIINEREAQLVAKDAQLRRAEEDRDSWERGYNMQKICADDWRTEGRKLQAEAGAAVIEKLTRENNQLLHDASTWRNRAIAAEEELAGASRLMPKGEQALIAGLVGALSNLANEASGFKLMADWTVHGYTNMAVLGLRIDEARAALALAAEEGL